MTQLTLQNLNKNNILNKKQTEADMKKDAKIIFSPQLANYLLGKGYTIIKLKPKHDNENETVYVFRLEDGLYETIEEWMAQSENK